MRTATRVLLAFAAVALLIVAPAAAEANPAPVWLPVDKLAGPDSYGAGVALNAGGDAVATWWVPSPPRAGSILVARYRGAAAGDWGKPVVVARGITGPPAVAIDGHGDAMVVWAEGRWPSRVIFWSSLAQTTGTWLPPTEISGPAAALDDPLVAADAAGDVTVGWRQRAGGVDHLRVAYRPAGGAWVTPTDITTMPAMYFPELVASEDGFTLLSWFERPAQTLRAALGYRGTWQPPATIASGDAVAALTYSGEHSSAIGTGGMAAVGWTAVRHGNAITQAAVRPAGESDWSAADSVSFEDGQAGVPQFAIDGNGDVTAVWATNVDLETSYRSADSGVWSRPVAVSTPSASGVFGAPEGLAANRAGDTVVLWTSFSTGGLLASVRPAGATAWGPPMTASALYRSLGTGKVAIDDAGDAISAWTDDLIGSSKEVLLATLDAATPQLEAMRVPRTAHAGKRVTLSAAFRDISSTSIQWRFGDGRRATGSRVSHSYRKPGRYAVSATATDAVGRTSGVKRVVTITR
jgi:PKD domain